MTVEKQYNYLRENKMKNIVFNKNIYIEYPDDFYEMGADEIARFFAGEIMRCAFRNAEKHVILSVAKTNASLLNMITDAKSVLNGAENSLKKNLKDYVCKERFDTEVFGKKAKGVCFEYKANTGERQFCEMTVVKFERCFYTVYCMSRSKEKDQFKDMFASFKSALKKVSD